jgi:hypothetical protein
MLGGWRRRRERKRRRRDEVILEGAFRQGFDARGAGRPCVPPTEYGADGDHELQAEWIAGWVEADRASPD